MGDLRSFPFSPETPDTQATGYINGIQSPRHQRNSHQDIYILKYLLKGHVSKKNHFALKLQ